MQDGTAQDLDIRTTAGAEPEVNELFARFATSAASIGIIGLGYVGLPLAKALAEKDFRVVGFDIDAAKVQQLQAGQSYIQHFPSETIRTLVTERQFITTTEFRYLAEVDAILICVPTPLTRHREPDLKYVVSTAESILPHLRRGQLIVLESTSYPGTTREVVRPILERSCLESGKDFFLAYSPEREDPGNTVYSTTSIPKVVGGDGTLALRLACALYQRIALSVVPVSSLEVAEAVKLSENIFRAVNIALVNELKLVYEAMGIDIWEVINAAKTKPFGFMPFYPGPGLGGHCIPIDPFYLTWKAREYGISTHFIELAGEINTMMPRHVVERLAAAMNARFARGVKNARILIAGIAYKKNVGDVRESPAFAVMELLEGRGALVDYHDPFVSRIPHSREHPNFSGRRGVPLDRSVLDSFDAALIITDHDGVDYRLLAEVCPLIIDTRNVFANNGIFLERIVKA